MRGDDRPQNFLCELEDTVAVATGGSMTHRNVRAHLHLCTMPHVDSEGCFSLAVFLSRCVSLSLCFSPAVFLSRCVSLSLCFSPAVFLSRCVSLSLYFYLAVFLSLVVCLFCADCKTLSQSHSHSLSHPLSLSHLLSLPQSLTEQ